MAPYMFSACICCYTALDPNDIKILLKEHNEFLCLTNDCCIALDDEGYGVGLDTNKAAAAAARAGVEAGNICTLKLFVCQCGLKKPEVLCSGASNCLCIKQANSIPFDKDFVKDPLCAVCFVQILPEVGLLKEAPALPSMVR